MLSTNVTCTKTSLEGETNLYFPLYTLLLTKINLIYIIQNKFKQNLFDKKKYSKH